jgi:DNA/RNA-binding domain of Phe-tRNA-synthetase-like protein
VPEPASEQGWIAPQLAEELPGLALTCLRVPGGARPSPKPLRQQLRELAGRIGGAKVVHSRQDTVPWAYRVLWRRLGLDPDSDRTPIERLMVERLEYGGLPSSGLPDDAIVVATIETGVPLLAFDAARVRGRLGLRTAQRDELLGGEGGVPLPAGEVTYADEETPIARLTGEVAPSHAVAGDTDATLLCALSAVGVPQIAVEEALWIAADLLRSAGTLGESSQGGRT